MPSRSNSEQSLVARAARTQEGVVVNDVQTDPDFLPNPLLPKTRAEMAVPMLVGGKVVGVLDVQSEQVNRFSDTDVDIQTTLASQIAVALQNARSFTNAQKQADRETKLNCDYPEYPKHSNHRRSHADYGPRTGSCAWPTPDVCGARSGCTGR